MICILATILFASSALAGIYTWNDTNGNWAANDNWVGGVAPSGADNTDVLNFGSTAGQVYTATNDIAGTFTLNQLVFNNNLGSAESISGNSLSLAGATPKVTHNGNSSILVFNDVDLSADTTFSGTSAATLQMRGAISGSGQLVKASSDTLELRGVNTYTGGTVVDKGLLLVNNSAGSGTGSGSVIINSGATVRVIGSVAGAVDVNKDGTIKGNGTVGALTIESGGILSPGSSPGTLHAGDTVWNGGGIYLWEIDNFNGSAGADPGWDLLDVSGTLNVAATENDRFIIDISSIAPGSDNFNKAQPYSMTIASAESGIIGFSASDFLLDTSDFSHPFLGYGFWRIDRTGNSLLLSYVTVPEPSAVLLWCLGLAIIAVPCVKRMRAREATI